MANGCVQKQSSWTQPLADHTLATSAAARQAARVHPADLPPELEAL